VTHDTSIDHFKDECFLANRVRNRKKCTQNAARVLWRWAGTNRVGMLAGFRCGKCPAGERGNRRGGEMSKGNCRENSGGFSGSMSGETCRQKCPGPWLTHTQTHRRRQLSTVCSIRAVLTSYRQTKQTIAKNKT